MNNELMLFLVSIMPIVLIGWFIYKKDKQKEPSKLLAKLFLGGILSCFLVVIVSLILDSIFPIFSADSTKLNLIELIIHVFIGIALVEEVCKWVIVYKMSYNDKEFDELYDAIVYSIFVALGFACIENLFYVYEHGITVGFIRALLAVPGHACYGMFMGYYLGLSKMSDLYQKKDDKTKYLILSVVIPTIAHGIYDYCLFTGNIMFIMLFLVFIIFMYIHFFKQIKKISSINRKMKYKDNYCSKCGRVVDSNYCPTCGNKNE